jgi:hypothetical protein
MLFPWKGMDYACGDVTCMPDAYYVPGTSIVREPVAVPGPVPESFGEFGQPLVFRPTVGTYMDRILANQNILSGFGQTAGEGSSAGVWIVGLSLGLAISIFAGTLMLSGKKG